MHVFNVGDRIRLIRTYERKDKRLFTGATGTIISSSQAILLANKGGSLHSYVNVLWDFDTNISDGGWWVDEGDAKGRLDIPTTACFEAIVDFAMEDTRSYLEAISQ